MYPVSRFDNRFQISRDGTEHGLSWSERVVRKHRGLASDSDSAGSSPPELLLPRPPAPAQAQTLKLPGRNCSSCSCRRSDTLVKKRRGSSTSVKREKNEKVQDVALHQLEAKLYNKELEEVAHMEDMEKVQEKFDRSSKILEALALYTQSLNLKARSLVRLTDLMENFAYKDLTPTDTLPKALDRILLDMNTLENLNDVQSSFMAASKTSEQVCQLLEDLREKRKHYLSATNNFSQYLRSCGKVSNNRLIKYESQYEVIRADYEDSRKTLEREYIKLINDRHESLVQELSKLVPIQEELVKHDNQFCSLSKEISKCLQGPFKKQSSPNILLSKQQENRKTKINHY